MSSYLQILCCLWKHVNAWSLPPSIKSIVTTRLRNHSMVYVTTVSVLFSSQGFPTHVKSYTVSSHRSSGIHVDVFTVSSHSPSDRHLIPDVAIWKIIDCAHRNSNHISIKIKHLHAMKWILKYLLHFTRLSHGALCLNRVRRTGGACSYKLG